MVNLTEVIGDPDPDRYGHPVSISAVLPLIDMAAGRCAYQRAAGSVVTGSLDDVELFTTLRHGDVISAQAEVLAVGKSSVLLRVSVSRNDLQDGKPRLLIVLTCHTTFVAVDQTTGKPRPIPPPVNPIQQSPCHHAEAQFLQLKYKRSRRFLSIDDLATLHAFAEACASFTTLYQYTAETEMQNIESTVIRIRKQFLPRHQNFSGVVFGGDILQTLERTAVACANRIQAGEARLETISIRSLSFLRPVPPTTVLQVEAKVIATSQQVVCVILRSYLDQGSEMVLCHQGIFHLMAVKRAGSNGVVAVGVRGIWKRDDEHINDFYRAMTLPLTNRVKVGWGLEGDAFPCEQGDNQEDFRISSS